MFTILLVRTIKRCLIINLENNENFDQSIVCIMLPTNIFHKLQKKKIHWTLLIHTRQKL